MTPKVVQAFVSRHSIACLVKYCIQIIYANNFYFIFFNLSYDQWGPPIDATYSDPILITLILSFIQ